MKLGPDVEPSEGDLLKAPHEGDDVAATGGPIAPETGVGAARRMGPKAFLQILGSGLITGASDDDPSGIGTYSPGRRPVWLWRCWQCRSSARELHCTRVSGSDIAFAGIS